MRAPSLTQLASALALATPLATATATASCKCLPDDPCWPSPPAWATLNATLSGRLLKSTPPGSVCYPSDPSYNATACATVRSSWTSASFHSSDPVSIDSPVWANSSCNPIYGNGTSVAGDVRAGEKGCSLGFYPVYVVNATEAGHVAAAMGFAAEAGVRVVVKNTGHNGAGRNTAAGSLSIWTHNMKGITYHSDFTPVGSHNANGTATAQGHSQGQMALTIGAGVQDGELFEAAAKYGIIAVGGTNKDVGVTGWALGGGHGLMTGHYGNGADNILQATVVTPTGSTLTANAFQNQDLFWAIRGGGGGTFGVVTELTLKAYPDPAVVLCGLDFTARNTTSEAKWWDLIAELHSLLPDVLEAGLSGYYTIKGPPDSAALGYGGSFFMYGANATTEKATAILHPLRQFLARHNGTVKAAASDACFRFDRFADLTAILPAFETVGTVNGITASRLLTKQTLRDASKRGLLARTLQEVGPRAVAPTDGLPNPSISGTMTLSSKPVANALPPAWRSATVHLITSRQMDDSYTPAQKAAMVADMTYSKLNALRELEPASGAYLNEANALEPGWQWSFYGEHYARLRSIKARVDPDGLLWCRQCVGSEDWVQDFEGRLCRAFMPF
ncbi:hypothetical protein BDW74DRAFT_190120 [Aspergillus multicolor]|uniref:uncharacterized protein n=1 Tax=Aspergillus multicolor TaxID=41759 RepID=UPI003CCE055B